MVEPCCEDLVSKQREELLRTTADRDRLNDERNRLREETRKLRELNESQLAVAEASLVEKHTSLARREQELGDLQADHERQRAEIEESFATWSPRAMTRPRAAAHSAARKDALARIRLQRGGSTATVLALAMAPSLAAWRPLAVGHWKILAPGRSAGVLPPSSVSSAYPSARGSAPRYNDSVPSTPGVQSPVTSSLRRPMRPVLSMDRDERAAFLSHFPMASRTERLMRSRIDGKR
eukprot:s2042_g4.t1